MATYTQTYARTHSIVFLSDNLRNSLREIIRENGLDPLRLMQDWQEIQNGVRTWLDSGHLKTVIVEFFKPGAGAASARWELPVLYTGSGAGGVLGLGKNYLRKPVLTPPRPTHRSPHPTTLSPYHLPPSLRR